MKIMSAISTVIVLFAMLLIAGCGDDGKQTSSPATSSSSQMAPSSNNAKDAKKRYPSTNQVVTKFNNNLNQAFNIVGTGSYQSFTAPSPSEKDWKWKGQMAQTKWYKSRNQDISYCYAVYDLGAKLCGRDFILRFNMNELDEKQAWGMIFATIMLVEEDKDKIVKITENLGIDTGIKPSRYYEYTDKARNAKFWVNTDIKDEKGWPTFQCEVGIHLRSNPFDEM